MASELAQTIRSLAEGKTVDPQTIRAAFGDDADAADAAVELARNVEALRRRSTELRAVMSSTRDLLTIADVDQMLQRIVERARELMELDVTYLSVYDAELDQLYVRAQTGIVSPRFVGMVVPAGVGLASLAVRTQRPQWVADYTAFTSVPHDPTVDAITREEQLRSLLGAPLVVGGRVLGVLFAASRQPHEFRPEEISLLSAFAGHAGLVLHLAQLLKDATDAGAEATSRQREAEWAASLHGELIKLVVLGHGADAIVDALAMALGREVTFVEDGSGAPADGAGVDARLRAAAASAAATGRSVVVKDNAVELVAPVTAVTARSGVLLVARGERELTSIERRTVERSGLIAALVMLRQDALAEAEERVRGEVAAELLDGPATRAAGVRRAAARGYPVTDPWTLVTVPCDPDERPRMLSRVRGHADWLAASAPLGVALLLPHTVNAQTEETSSHDRARADARRVQRVVGAAGPLVVASVHDDIDAAAAAAQTMWQSARLALGLGITEGAMDAALLAPYTALFEGDGPRLAAFVESMLAPIREWDRAHGADLMGTLAVLFDERWSLTVSARVLKIHVNTMKQRMQRLRDLLGAQVDAPESRFRLELAVRIEKARRAAQGT